MISSWLPENCRLLALPLQHFFFGKESLVFGICMTSTQTLLNTRSFPCASFIKPLNSLRSLGLKLVGSLTTMKVKVKL